jgi:hypothetical protein
MLFRAGVLGWVIVLFSCCAGGQEPSSAAHRRVSGDIYAGYSRIAPNFGTNFLGGPGENGALAGGDLHLTRLFAVTAEAGWFPVTYGSQLSSRTFTMMAGGRLFFPPRSQSRVKLLADVLAGAANLSQLIGANVPFTGRVALAVAADGGAEFRVFGPLAMRVEGGYLHTGYQSRDPSIPQSSIHNQHGRLLVEGAWHF